MGTIIIKPDRNEDFYVGWSTGVEAPVWLIVAEFGLGGEG